MSDFIFKTEEGERELERAYSEGYEAGRTDERAKVIEAFTSAMIVMMPGHKQDILHIAEQLNSAK